MLHACGACARRAPSSPRELWEVSAAFVSFHSDREAWSTAGELNQTKASTRMSSAKDPPASVGIVSGTALRLEGKVRSKA